MKILFDTNVLIAALLPDHQHHGSAAPWLAAARTAALDVVVSGHSLAELYSVLTRLPRVPRISPQDALTLIQDNITPYARIATLSGEEYVRLIEQLAQHGVAGGTVYDAIIAAVAEQSSVDRLLTINVRHFERVWPSHA